MLNTLKSILDEANLLLSDTQDSIKSITNKSNDLFKILIVIVIALLGFAFTNKLTLIVGILSIYYIVSISILLILLYSNIYPKKNALVGIEPKKVITDEIIKTDLDKNEKRILFKYIQNAQIAVDNNIQIHHKLFRKYRLIINLLLVSIYISIAIFFVCQVLIPFLSMCYHLLTE